MVFRAEESINNGFEKALKILTPREANSLQLDNIRKRLSDISDKWGPFVEGYPAWHPFLMESDPAHYAPTLPQGDGCFRHLDHSVYLSNAILTCPYSHGVDELFESVSLLKHRDAIFKIVKINDIILYNESAVPILITCQWKQGLCDDGTVPVSTALGLMLEREIPNWRNATFSESWERMQGQILGYPHGARSSLFVNQQTGQVLKTTWNQLEKAGLWGNERK